MTSTRLARPRLLVATALGVSAVVAGVLVLHSPSASLVGVGWFSYGAPPPGVIARLMAWNSTGLAGAGLIVAGLLVLATAFGAAWSGRRRHRPGRRALLLAWSMSAALVLLGSVALVIPRPTEVS